MQNKQEEIWKDIPGYENIYQVSNLGNVKSLERIILNNGKYPFLSKEKLLKNGLDNRGYNLVVLYKNKKTKTFKTHQLVAIAFLNHIPDGTNKIVVDHINEIKTDNRLENLQLLTNRENCSKDRKNKTSKYVGVVWHKKNKKWQADIFLNGEKKYLGCFENEIDASNAYQNKLKELKQLN